METTQLRREARRADATMKRGRQMLVDAVRTANAQGMSQRQIANAIGRSQPEVHRLLHFHGESPAGLALRKARPQVLKILAESELNNPRVFGSVARGEDGPNSDVDLLVTPARTHGLLSLAKIEHKLSSAIGREVDLVLDNGIRPDLAPDILESAVNL